ncbi:MAG: hypothetical protein QXS96_04795 [Candidatus Caldarchaeum sp.]
MRREVVVWRWFNVTKVKNPSKEEPEDELVLTMHGYVLDKADLPLYNMLGYWSKINIYDRHNYFLARQYMIDMYAKDAKYNSLYAEYHLTLTDEAWAIVDTLLREPFTCHVKQRRTRTGALYYEISTQHSAYIPHPTTGKLEEGAWALVIYLYLIPSIDTYRSYTTIPFNCGPLRPLWLQAVECWIEKLGRKLRSNHVAEIRDILLQYKILYDYIIPAYELKSP